MASSRAPRAPARRSRCKRSRSSSRRIGVPVFMADVKGDLSGLGAAGGSNAKVDGARGRSRHRASLRSLSRRVLGRVRQTRASDSRDGVRSGAAAARAAAAIERHAGRRAESRVQDRRRRRAAAARPQGPARDAAARRRARSRVHDGVRQRLGRVDRRDPARTARARDAGRRADLRRADAEHRRSACRPRTAAASSTSSPPIGS